MPWAYLASNLYHNAFWLNVVGKACIRQMMATEWGKLWGGTRRGERNMGKMFQVIDEGVAYEFEEAE